MTARKPRGNDDQLQQKAAGASKPDLPKAVLLDLDGTVLTVTSGWTPESNAEWEQRTMSASVIQLAAYVVLLLKQEGYRIVVLTARGMTCKKYTMRKLRETGLIELVDSVYHRPVRYEGVRSASYKEAMVRMLAKRYAFEHALDDEDPNLEVFRKLGIPNIWDAKAFWDPKGFVGYDARKAER